MSGPKYAPGDPTALAVAAAAEQAAARSRRRRGLALHDVGALAGGVEAGLVHRPPVALGTILLLLLLALACLGIGIHALRRV